MIDLIQTDTNVSARDLFIFIPYKVKRKPH